MIQIILLSLFFLTCVGMMVSVWNSPDGNNLDLEPFIKQVRKEQCLKKHCVYCGVSKQGKRCKGCGA